VHQKRWSNSESTRSTNKERERFSCIPFLKASSIVSGITPSIYINRFLSAFNELEKIPGHKMNKQEAKSLFLRKIQDTEYSSLKETLEINVVTSYENVTV